MRRHPFDARKRIQPAGDTRFPVVGRSPESTSGSQPGGRTFDCKCVVGHHRARIRAESFSGTLLADERGIEIHDPQHHGRLARESIHVIGSNSGIILQFVLMSRSGIGVLSTQRRAVFESRFRRLLRAGNADRKLWTTTSDDVRERHQPIGYLSAFLKKAAVSSYPNAR